MKNSNKLLVAVALLALLPTALTLLLTIKRTNRTIELINSIETCNINVVDARNANITIAPNEDAFSKMDVIWLENGSDEDNIVQLKGDTLVVGRQVTRLCIPNAKRLILPDTVVENPFYYKGDGKYAIYVAK